IAWSANRHLNITVNVRGDTDNSGTLTSDDGVVSSSSTALTLTRDTDGDGLFECGGDDQCWNLSGTTNSSGDVKFKLLNAPAGSYEAEVTSLTHATFVWDPSL